MRKIKYFGVGVAVMMVMLSMAVVSSAPVTTQEVNEYEDDGTDDFFPRGNVPSMGEILRKQIDKYGYGFEGPYVMREVFMAYNYNSWPSMSYVPDGMGFDDEENQQSTYYNDWYWEVHYEEWNVALPDYMT